MALVPKILGHDYELSNTLMVNDNLDGRPHEAARRLLAEISGFPLHRSARGTFIEYGRRFLQENGLSTYIDSDHFEINSPEHRSALDHGLWLHAGLRMVQRAMREASRKLPDQTRLRVAANCSDGREAWGSHLNVCLSAETFCDLHYRKPHLAGFFATHLVTSVLYTGQGMVGAGNGRAACSYQLSQRADWFEEFAAMQTTYSRPLLNLRAEHHADGRPDLAREHIIYLDNVLCPIANTLKSGTCQLILTLCEAGWIDARLQLDDPVRVASDISRDLSLKQKFPTAVRGVSMSALEIQQALVDLAEEFVAAGLAEGIVADAGQIVALWKETLDMLRQRDFAALAQRCDNWLKYILVERQRGRKGLAWSSPELKVLDLLYPSLDESESLFFAMARAGSVEGMPAEQELDLARSEPPEDTRAYLRAQALRRFGEHVDSMDWGYIRFSIPQGRWWSSVARLSMPDPGGYGRAVVEGILGSCQELDEFVETINGLAPQREMESRASHTLTAWGEAPGKSAFAAVATGYGVNGSNPRGD